MNDGLPRIFLVLFGLVLLGLIATVVLEARGL